ncbi:MAG: acetyl-CoA hydrolase [Proteobacteria bacterium]|nr:acetyl-CoA hydrolase [Pseudomonadota bacterium]
MTIKVQNLSECIESVIAINGRELIVGTPLGIGKPNPLLNAIWAKAKAESDLKLEIFTALSLQVPKGKSLLEVNFLKPFTDRVFGEDYPDLDYIQDVIDNNIPDNMRLTEFYMQSGKMLRSATAQKNYTSSNYTHAARDMLNKGMNVLMQMVAVKQTASGRVYSLSCNTDLTLDIVASSNKKGIKKPCMVAMVNPNLPFMGGNAQVEDDFFDIILDDESLYFKPFATPRASINTIDYNIGLLASCLIKDGGTMQVGIGSLGDALIYSTQLRHQNNSEYLKLINGLQIKDKFHSIIDSAGSLSVFDKGLYAASEMFVEGFAHLFDANILKRKVYPDAQIQALINQSVITEKIQDNIIEILLQNNVLDEFISKKQMLRLQYLGILKGDLQMIKLRNKNFLKDSNGKKYDTDLFHYENIQAIQENCLGQQLKQGSVLHGAFFLGSPWFYQWLHQLDETKRDLFQMVAVSQVNELYGGEALDRVQRINARFINTCMKVDLLGAAASDALDNNQVVSGVGGQYNFVAMAQTLEDSRSILMLRSTHKGRQSNIVWKYPYCTIPRHLRDIVITEYGIADLRGQSDEECVKRMICIADSRFQEELRATAVKFNKLDTNWLVPKAFLSNTLENLESNYKPFKQDGYFPSYPFGSDFTEVELTIIKALTFLKANTQNSFSKIKLMIKAYINSPKSDFRPFLERMDLLEAQSIKEKITQKLLKYALDKIK